MLSLIIVMFVMQMQIIIGPQNAAERAMHLGMVEDLHQLGHPRQQIVTRIAALLDRRLDTVVDPLVEAIGKIGLEGDIAVANKTLHGLVVEKDRCVAHR